ncbi:autotransporter outer membrane beta-barrel domain-containing protein [Breoghania sp.]|uniref:autotransporter outer membrane beta-barrel domain-containing protein n=1 Tax=Breoghania sp. TaxID=2065378 RepID=UPI002AA7529C|nr:autotransporter outer membrane beta-barrel domain-containing protein [Breoghania sp.]
MIGAKRILAALVLVMGAMVATAHTAIAQPTFSASFSPSTVAENGQSTLIFTITNGSGTPVTAMTFSNTLPAGLTLAADPQESTTCTNATINVTGPDSFTFEGDGSGGGASVAASSSCTVSVAVQAGTPGSYNNTSGNLTTSAGASGTAAATLTVDAARLQLAMAFSPATTTVGGTSRLIYTITNPTAVVVTGISLSNTLPNGLEVATPSGVTTTCAGSGPTAAEGGSSVSLAGGFFAGAGSCTVEVTVKATNAGSFYNSATLTSSQGSSGSAAAVLSVPAPTGALTMVKQFNRASVAPGAELEVTYRINNTDGSSAATGIAFTDDFDAALSGLTATSLPASDVCGPGSQLTGSSTLSLSGGNLGARSSCEFTVTVAVPAGAPDGTVTSTTSSLSGTVAGSGVTGDPASASVSVITTTPVMTKSFTDDPVAAGNTVTLEYVITNPSSTTALSSIGFTDSLGDMANASVSAGTGTDLCGAGSLLYMQSISGVDTLILSGGNIPASGSCTLTLTLAIPDNTSSGDYLSTSSQVTSDSGTGAPASDTLTISPPALDVSLVKTFLDDPVLPGATVTLEFTLTNNDEANGLTSLSFSDDLDAMLSGAVATGLPVNNVCGTGSTLTGTSVISLSGGVLAADAECTFQIDVQVPGGATDGTYPNTTSDVSGDSGAGVVSVPGSAATDNLVVSSAIAVTGVQSFTDDPVFPGADVTLQYTLTNPNPSNDATGIAFSASMSSLGLPSPGLTLSGSLPSDPCGTGSALSLSGGATGNLLLTGGNILAAQSCTFSIAFTVPASAGAGYYNSNSSLISSTVGGVGQTSNSVMSDTLTVSSPFDNIAFSTSFTDDPVESGGTVTLQFVLDNTVNTVAIDSASFTDDLSQLGFAATATADSGSCAGGGTWSVSGTTNLSATVSNLPAGQSCTFSVAVAIPGGANPGIQTNTTSNVAVTIGAASGSVPAASDTLTVTPTTVTLQKSFSGDPVAPGGTFQVTYTILSPSGGGALSDIRFTDDYDAALAGLVVTGTLPSDPCGTGSVLSGTSVLQLTGGALAPAATCQFTVNLAVPANAPPQTYSSTSSDLFETSAVIAPAVTDTFQVSNPAENVSFTLQFTDDPIPAGGIVTARYTITNPDASASVTGITFEHNFATVISGVTYSLQSNSCSGSISAPTAGTIRLNNATLTPGATCTVVAEVSVPLATTAASYTMTTGTMTAAVNGVSTNVGTASDTLTVGNQPQFTVTSGDFNTSGVAGGPFTGTMDYVVTNTGNFPLSYTVAASQTFIGLSATSGTIAAGSTATVTVSITSVANGFTASVTPYSGTVTFTNVSASGPPTEVRNVNLTVQNQGSVTVSVNTAGGDGTFAFTSSDSNLNGLSITTTNGAGTAAAVAVIVGSHTLTLPTSGMPDGFGLASISCTETGGTTNTSVNVGSGTVSLQVEASETISCVFSTANSRGRTTEVINRFLHKRVDMILSNEPGQNRRIDRLKNRFGGGASGTGTPFDVTAAQSTGGGVAMAFESSVSQIRAAYAAEDAAKRAMIATSGVFANNPSGLPPEQTLWDVWFRGSFTWFEDNSGGTDSDGVFAIFHAGADYLVTDRVLVGALFQLDYLDQDFTELGASANGVGWMAGPYATLRLTDNLYFDTRAAWGTSANEISPFNTYTDDFTTTRWLVRAGLIGDWSFGAWNVRPSANVAYMQETQEGYTDSLSVYIPEQTVGVGQFDFGPEVSYTYQTPNGFFVAPRAKLTGIWNFKRDTYGSTTTTSAAGVEMRAKAELGVNVRMPSGVRLEANGSYDGIGAEDYNAMTGELKLTVPLN